jgi:hypothetical protein
MKVYNLSCEQSHHFEGWFASEEDFVKQSDQGLIECPVCNDRSIKRLPSAPRLNLSSAPEPQAQADAAQQVHAQWMRIAQEILANTEDVGANFAEEARRIYYNEAPQRGIRGVASADEREALSEEGIEVLQFPLPAAPKQPLQ